MVAYFALLSFVPLIFLALSLFGLAHRAEASDFFVKRAEARLPRHVARQHHQARPPGAGQRRGARDHRRHRPALVVALALQRARVGAQHRLRAAEPALPPREGLAAALMASVLTTLFVEPRRRRARRQRAEAQPRASRTAPSSPTSLSIGASLVGVFVFLLAVYRWLPNTEVELARRAARRSAGRGRARGVVPGAADVRPLRRRQRDAADARRPGDPADLALRDGERDRLRRRDQLVVAGASASACRSARAARARCECSAFQSFPSSATVRSSPSGMKIGS